MSNVYNQIITFFNERFFTPRIGEWAVGIVSAEAPWIDKEILNLYGNEFIQEFDMDDTFVWVRQNGSNTTHRLRYNWPFRIQFDLGD